MNKLLTMLLLIFSVISCSSVDLSKKDRTYVLFEDVLMKEKEISDFFIEFEKTGGDQINKASIDIIRENLNAQIYNEKLIDFAKSHKNFKRFDDIQSSYLLGSIAKKVQLLRIDKVDSNEFSEYIENFKNLEDSSRRIELIEAIIRNDFPRYVSGHLIAHVSTLSIKDIKKENIEVGYKKIISGIDMVTFKLNLYIFQKLKISDLEELVKSQQSEDYKFIRKFIEECQSKINNEVLSSIKKQLISKKINMETIQKLEELKSNGTIDL